MKTIMIVGVAGNMGSRYKSIVEYLGHRWCGVDAGYDLDEYKQLAEKADGIIIASPTATHLQELVQALHFDKPILVEKPITTNLSDLEAFDLAYKGKTSLITMVNQYVDMDHDKQHVKVSPRHSHYNYFKTGKDGLAWDCINIIGLADNPPIIRNVSPVWTAIINGNVLDISQMDHAYISMIDRWINGEPCNWDYALEAHRKVGEWLQKS